MARGVLYCVGYLPIVPGPPDARPNCTVHSHYRAPPKMAHSAIFPGFSKPFGAPIISTGRSHYRAPPKMAHSAIFPHFCSGGNACECRRGRVQRARVGAAVESGRAIARKRRFRAPQEDILPSEQPESERWMQEELPRTFRARHFPVLAVFLHRILAHRIRQYLPPVHIQFPAEIVE